jgi:RNA polymerase sigma factor (sigma-70 family)
VLTLLLEAVEAYAPHRPGKRPCRFRTFLGLILNRRFYDLMRGLRRVRKHLDYSVIVSDMLSRSASQEVSAVPRSGWANRDLSDPEAAAAWRELRERLDRALGQLDAADRWLWEQSAAGTPLRALALQLGLPYHQVRRQRRAIRAFLKARLKDWNE